MSFFFCKGYFLDSYVNENCHAHAFGCLCLLSQQPCVYGEANGAEGIPVQESLGYNEMAIKARGHDSSFSFSLSCVSLFLKYQPVGI